MATSAEINEARRDSELAILNAIINRAKNVSGASNIRDLAEAWAWVTSPNNGHGGQSSS